ncbi:proline-rich protein PRCC-like isoform X2 [Asterias rubens]|uniref:proline-rich protein PRCC-like isoform X2 n=1 Tax=Asterias rubens TaxID=7604 RepID=UPI0014554B49|nr:proline-rich protein PRCC-like isoform X2 [Asterias rubens]
MSLVNYYSSSDDENSGDDDKTEDYVESEIGSSSSAADSSNSDRQTAPKPSLFRSLPAPRSSQISIPEEAERTQPSNVHQESSSLRRLGSLNLPLPKKRSKQPIKITAPSLPQMNSDDEDDEPASKKQKPATSLSGLFAMLPKPRNASIKEANRILIPHTLTKKPAPKKPPPKPVSKPTQASLNTASKTTGGLLATSYGSDDHDEEEGEDGKSFFSFGGSANVTPTSSLKTAVDLAPLNTGPGRSKINKVSYSSTGQTKVSNNEPGPQSGRLPQPGSDAPLSFRSSSSSQDSPLSLKPSSNPPYSQDSPLDFSNSNAQYGYHDSQYTDQQAYAAALGYQYTEYNQPYQEQDPPVYADQQGGNSGEGQGAGPSQSGASSNLEADKEFRRVMGKRNIGKEAINMIEIAADEQIGPNNGLDWMTKSLTEEKEYRVKLKKEQLPSGQQKRKHQITFLAHQAKERELELKNQWANNRQTRQQTQMKYGF